MANARELGPAGVRDVRGTATATTAERVPARAHRDPTSEGMGVSGPKSDHEESARALHRPPRNFRLRRCLHAGSVWAQLLDGALHPDDQPGDPEAVVQSEGSPTLLFQQVREGKTVKNRLHLDLQPRGIRRDDEVDRLLALGATVVGDHRRPDGTGWVTMADIEGNEFCVERSDVERAATGG